MNVFVGKHSKPTFLLDIKLNTIAIYQPDKISLNEKGLDFFEKYSLGELVLEEKFIDITFTKKNPERYYRSSDNFYVPEVLIKTKDYYILLNSEMDISKIIK